MGVVFEEDSKSQRLIVCDLVEGSVAYQRAKVRLFGTPMGVIEADYSKTCPSASLP